MAKIAFFLVALFLVFPSHGQIFNPRDTALRKSFEEPLSKAKKKEDRRKEVERLVDSWTDIRFMAFFIVGAPHLYLNPENVHTSSKDFLEFLHDRYNKNSKQIFVRKLQNNILKGQTEELVCHLIVTAKKKFPEMKVMLVGHSYGGSGAVRIANCLDQNRTYLEELVTVDTVKRPVDIGVDVWDIPWAVIENFHFHQKHGIFRGPKANHRPDGSTEGIESYRQFIMKGVFNPHMYTFTNLVRYQILQTLALRVFEPSAEHDFAFRTTLWSYLEKHPLE
ncbi:MAG: hypothetical protein AB7F59_05885 [Bdellovibrionales bacterium]